MYALSCSCTTTSHIASWVAGGASRIVSGAERWWDFTAGSNSYYPPLLLPSRKVFQLGIDRIQASTSRFFSCCWCSIQMGRKILVVVIVIIRCTTWLSTFFLDCVVCTLPHPAPYWYFFQCKYQEENEAVLEQWDLYVIGWWWQQRDG